jgi:hypothetical protein
MDARAKVRALSADIADMLSTTVRVGERDGWDSPLYRAIKRDIARWEERRARLLRSLEKYAA